MKITIKKSSKLGRYYAFLADKMPIDYVWHNLSLCKLVQTLFWGTLFTAIFAVFVLGSLLASIFILLYPILFLVGWVSYESTVLFASLALWTFFLSLGAIAGYREYIKSKLSVEEKPSIVMEWLKAKKAKVCPLINVEP